MLVTPSQIPAYILVYSTRSKLPLVREVYAVQQSLEPAFRSQGI